MTPERLAELRAFVDRKGGTGVVELNRTTLRELLDHVDAQRGEIADLLSRLDAAAFGATQVHNALKAADEMRVEFENEHVGDWMGPGGMICKSVDKSCKTMLAYDEARAKTLGAK